MSDMVRNTAMDEFMNGFVKVSDVGTNPKWPEHTGQTTWCNGKWKIIEIRRGGLKAWVEYEVYKDEVFIESISPSYSQYAPHVMFNRALDAIVLREGVS